MDSGYIEEQHKIDGIEHLLNPEQEIFFIRYQQIAEYFMHCSECLSEPSLPNYATQITLF